MKLSKSESQPPAYDDLDNIPTPSDSTYTLPLYVDDPNTVTHQSTSITDGQFDHDDRPHRSLTRAAKIKLAIFSVILFVAGYKLASSLRSRSRCCLHKDASDTALNLNPVSYNNRSILIRENTLPITGDFPLYDLLDLSTVTGSIDITIAPNPGPNPAVLKLRSVTGSITVTLRDDYLSYDPDAIERNHLELPVLYDNNAVYFAALARQFNTEISTNTGAITVTHLVGGGGSMSVSSQTGSLELDLRAMNVGARDPVTELRTVTHTGVQNVRVADFNRGGGKIVNLAGLHRSLATGNVDVRYSEEWEGTLEATVLGTGRADVAGEGLIVDEYRGGKYVKAHKGEGKEKGGVSLLGLGTGSLRFRC